MTEFLEIHSSEKQMILYEKENVMGLGRWVSKLLTLLCIELQPLCFPDTINKSLD